MGGAKEVFATGNSHHVTDACVSLCWTLLDFGCVVVHIFSEEMRSFYSLDRLWSDAEKIDYKDFL